MSQSRILSLPYFILIVTFGLAACKPSESSQRPFVSLDKRADWETGSVRHWLFELRPTNFPDGCLALLSGGKSKETAVLSCVEFIKMNKQLFIIVSTDKATGTATFTSCSHDFAESVTSKGLGVEKKIPQGLIGDYSCSMSNPSMGVGSEIWRAPTQGDSWVELRFISAAELAKLNR